MDTNDIVTTAVTITLFVFNFLYEVWNQHKNARDYKDINLKTDYYRDEQVKSLRDMVKSLNLLPERLGFYLQLITDNHSNIKSLEPQQNFDLDNRNNNQDKMPKTEQVKNDLVGL